MFGNNQHSEGIVKNEKGKPDIRLTCQEPDSYILERYGEYRRFTLTLVKDVEKAQHTIVIRNKKAADKEKMAENSEEEATEYVIENEQQNRTNTTWDTVHTVNNNMEERRRELMEIFERTSSSRYSGANNRPMFTMLEQNVQSEVAGNFEGMRYGTFNKWMNGTIKSKHDIKPSVKRVFKSFIDKHNN